MSATDFKVIDTVEIKRLSALHRLQVLDSQYEAVYDSITKLLAKLCDVPVALITMVDEQRVWFKSVVGLPRGVTQVPRKELFCGWIVKHQEYLEIEDLVQDTLHATNFLVTGDSKFRFFAGAPIKLPLGEVIGSLCVFDIKPNKLSDLRREAMTGLADVVSKALIIRSFAKKNIVG